jgi:hypothetical protein
MPYKRFSPLSYTFWSPNVTRVATKRRLFQHPQAFALTIGLLNGNFSPTIVGGDKNMPKYLHIFVNGRKFDARDGVQEFMDGVEIADLVGILK